MTLGRRSAGADLEPWVRLSLAATDPRLRLLCFHHAGGGASFFRDWPGMLAPHGIEVWPVQLPGREGRFSEPKPTDLPGLVAELVDFFAAPLSDLPYALYGHSRGAYVACAFAAEMSVRGQGPLHLLTGAARPPEHPDPDSPLHRMDDDRLLAKLTSYGGMSQELLGFPELVELAVNTARADLRLTETAPWPETPWFDCPLTAVGGRDDKSVPVALLPYWRSASTASTDVLVLDGGHFPRFWTGGRLVEVISRAGQRKT